MFTSTRPNNAIVLLRMTMHRILLVDDEPNVLNALRRELAGHGDYEVETFTSPAEALVRAQDTPFDLVISDYKMPGMDGVAFLQVFQHLQPDAARLLLSGQADRDVLAHAINSTHIYRFITKPWNRLDLVSVVTQALAFRLVALENRRLADACRLSNGGCLPAGEPGRHYAILVVDDDEGVLNAIWRELSHHNHYHDLYAMLRRDAGGEQAVDGGDFLFSVDTCDSPQEALERLSQVDFDVVLADYKMPGMNGVELLAKVRETQPHAARILLSGEADTQALVDAVDRAEIHAFVGKPWTEYDLRSAVTQAVVCRNIVRENRELAKRLG